MDRAVTEIFWSLVLHKLFYILNFKLYPDKLYLMATDKNDNSEVCPSQSLCSILSCYKLLTCPNLNRWNVTFNLYKHPLLLISIEHFSILIGMYKIDRKFHYSLVMLVWNKRDILFNMRHNATDISPTDEIIFPCILVS